MVPRWVVLRALCMQARLGGLCALARALPRRLAVPHRCMHPGRGGGRSSRHPHTARADGQPSMRAVSAMLTNSARGARGRHGQLPCICGAWRCACGVETMPMHAAAPASEHAWLRVSTEGLAHCWEAVSCTSIRGPSEQGLCPPRTGAHQRAHTAYPRPAPCPSTPRHATAAPPAPPPPPARSSAAILHKTLENGGSNRVSEEQIKAFLKGTLGEAPQPDWGLPNGWGLYLAGEWVGGP